MEIKTTEMILLNQKAMKSLSDYYGVSKDLQKKWVNVKSLKKILNDDSILDIEEYLREELFS